MEKTGVTYREARGFEHVINGGHGESRYLRAGTLLDIQMEYRKRGTEFKVTRGGHPRPGAAYLSKCNDQKQQLQPKLEQHHARMHARTHTHTHTHLATSKNKIQNSLMYRGGGRGRSRQTDRQTVKFFLNQQRVRPGCLHPKWSQQFQRQNETS